MSPSNRSKSPPKVVRQADSSPKRLVSYETINTERLKLARDEAEKAMKEHKIFTIIGPYPALRESLRRRGWVEKFYRGSTLPSVHGSKKSDKKNSKSDDDDDDDNDDDNDDDDLDDHPSYEDEDKVPPWEENDGYYGILSRLVRTAAPNFIWSVRASYDTSTLTKDQMVNHYSRNGCFTTKVGLCNSLRNLQWFHSGCADEFYPRCYKLSQEDDKVAFVDDYRLTACVSFLKLIQNRCKGVIEPDMNSILAMSSDGPNDPKTPLPTIDEQLPLTRSLTLPPGQLISKPSNGKSSARKVPMSAIEFALNKVNHYTTSRDHEDIDMDADAHIDPSDEQWLQFIDQFYAASHSNVDIEGMERYLNKIDECLKSVELHCPQYHIDGTRNIWILKPGAKSRGRGIVVYDRLEDILKLCSSTLTKDGKFVVQKYIERPLLIHNTKFDIRQWFLVTDWNPLTIWMFKDCYLRFCTEHFSLETRQQSVHLCNYSIQKHYKNNSNRHNDLPVENMWTNREFVDKYLRPNHLADRWDKLIYPAMKDAIICSMLVAQDTIDARKNSFELFGADFMLGEDLKPWLIEINCSPTMARSTVVTTEMCDGVLEDTCKVMIDRKYNRTADTGRFELIHRGTPVPVPIYVGIDLRVEGKPCKTGRPVNNFSAAASPEIQSNHTNTNALNSHASAPSHMNSLSLLSSMSTTPAENRPILAHSASVLATHTQSSSAKNVNSPISLKLRREVTQPTLTRIDITPPADSALEKLATDENFLFHFRAVSNNNNFNTTSSNYNNNNNSNNNNNNNINAKSNQNQNQIQQVDLRQRALKVTPTRLSVDYLPIRQLSRTKMNNNSLPSPKDVKLPKSFPFCRPYQRTCISSKFSQSLSSTLTTTTNHSKLIKQPKSAIDSSNFVTVSVLTIPSTIGTISTVDSNHGHNASSSILAVV